MKIPIIISLKNKAPRYSEVEHNGDSEHIEHGMQFDIAPEWGECAENVVTCHCFCNQCQTAYINDLLSLRQHIKVILVRFPTEGISSFVEKAAKDNVLIEEWNNYKLLFAVLQNAEAKLIEYEESMKLDNLK